MNETPRTHDQWDAGPHRHGSHGWMMISCCIPMLAIAVALVATGVVGVGFIFVAVICTLMKALMMRVMHGDSGEEKQPAAPPNAITG